MTSDPRQPRDIPAGDISRPGVRRSRPPAIPRRDRPLDSLRQISWRLESRDYVLAHLLTEHRVLTTAQITAVLFTSPRTCRNRLDVLRKLNFIDWFIPVRHGRRLATHWVPGPLSARYVALAHGERPPTPKSVRQHQDTMVSTSHLAHTDGTNQFFIDLLSHTRRHPDTRLARWWSAAHVANALGRRVQPDGHGVWSDATGNVAFLLEYDTGTETLGTLTDKLEPYQRLRTDGGPDWPILFSLPSSARETNLHQKLAGKPRARAGLTVATCARDRVNGAGPAGSVWRLAGNGRRRLRLAELPSSPGQPGPYHPGPPTAEHDPLYLLNTYRGEAHQPFSPTPADIPSQNVTGVREQLRRRSQS